MENVLDKQRQLQEKLSLGHSHIRRKQLPEAVENFQEALKLAEEIEDETILNEANLQLGHAHRLNNQIQMAIEHYEKVFEIARQRRDKTKEATAYVGLGHTYMQNNQTQRAILRKSLGNCEGTRR